MEIAPNVQKDVIIGAHPGCGHEPESHVTRLLLCIPDIEDNWDEIVAMSSLGKARVWRLYLAGSATRFAWNQLHVHQVLGLKAGDGPTAVGMPLRPTWTGPLNPPGKGAA